MVTFTYLTTFKLENEGTLEGGRSLRHGEILAAMQRLDCGVCVVPHTPYTSCAAEETSAHVSAPPPDKSLKPSAENLFRHWPSLRDSALIRRDFFFKNQE